MSIVAKKSPRRIIAKKGRREFALIDKGGKEIGVFTGKAPRQAALKAANRGHVDIRLKAPGTNIVHLFTGKRKKEKKPASAPAWMPTEIWKSNVKKVGIERFQGLTSIKGIVKGHFVVGELHAGEDLVGCKIKKVGGLPGDPTIPPKFPWRKK